MALRYYEGTVSAKGADLDAEETAKKLRKAMKGFGTDEKVIIEVLATHCNYELQLIKDQYKTLFGRILGEDFQKELSGHFEKLCLYLLLPRPHFRAYCLHQAIQGLGTDEQTLVEILCTSNNREILEIREAYQDRFKTNIEKDIVGDTSGDFKYLLIGILQGNRSEEQEIDAALVEQDVKELHKAGIKKIGTDESVFTRILVRRSIPHLQKVFESYLHKHQLSIIDVVKKETSGCLKKGYKTIVQYVMSPCEYFAKCLHKCLSGPGTDDERLMQLVVNHCEVDLKDIASAYLQKYHVGLSKAVHDDTSGDYRKLLVHLTNIGY